MQCRRCAALKARDTRAEQHIGEAITRRAGGDGNNGQGVAGGGGPRAVAEEEALHEGQACGGAGGDCMIAVW